MGIIGSTSASLGSFGHEGAGIIRKIGPGVKHLSVGDRVFMVSTGCFSTSFVTSEAGCEKIPDTLTFEDAATMPCVFATVIYSLIHVGRLEQGQVSWGH